MDLALNNRQRLTCHKTQQTNHQRGDISILKGGPLKVVDKFKYLGSSVSLTENDINTWLAKSWTVIDWLSVIWKSDLTNKMKRVFFQAAVVLILLYGCTTCTLSVWRKSFTAIIQECCEPYWTSPGGNTLQNSSCTATYQPSKNYPDMQDTAGEVRMNT